MEGVTSVEQLGHRAELGRRDRRRPPAVGRHDRRQEPDQVVAGRRPTGATNEGSVSFEPVGEDRTRVDVRMDFERNRGVESVGDLLGVVDRRAERRSRAVQAALIEEPRRGDQGLAG